MSSSASRKAAAAKLRAEKALQAESATLELDYEPAALLYEGPIILTDLGVAQAHGTALRAAGHPVPPRVRCRFLIDTGADGCVVRHEIAERAGLKLISEGVRLDGIGVDASGRIYMGRIHFGIQSKRVPGARHDIAIETRVMSGAIQSDRIDGLIGRDVLSHFDMRYNGKTGKVTLRFCK